jgi:hypothetical protein
MNFDFKKLLPHAVAIALFYAITLIYFSPVMKGYTLIQGDVSSFKGMSKAIQDHRTTYGEEPLWTGAMFSGMPAYQVTVRYTSNLLGYLDRMFQGFLYGPIGNLFLCFVAFYILLCTLRINPWLSIAGAVAFGLSSYFPILIEAGHNSKLHAIGYLPAILAGFLMTYRGEWKWGAVIFGIFLSLEIYSNHVQVTYYFAIFCVILAAAIAVDLFRNGRLNEFIKYTAILALASGLAVMSNAANLWNTYQYTKKTMRGGSELTILPSGEENVNRTSGLDLDYLTQWSYGIDESWSLLVPAVKGNGSGAVEYQRGRQINAYWGEQPFTSGPVYVGAFICVLFVLGLFLISGPMKWAVAIAMPIFFMMAWGKHMMGFTELLADYLPMYNRFRTPSMALLIPELIMPLLGILAVDKLLKEPDLLKDKKIRNQVYGTVGGFAIILLLFGLAPTSFFDFFSSQEEAQFASMQGSAAQMAQIQGAIEDFRVSTFTADVWRSFFIILIGSGLVYFFSKKKNTLALAGLLTVLFLFDLWMVDKRFVNNEKVRGKYVRWEKAKPNYYAEHLPSKADEYIFQKAAQIDPEIGRMAKEASDEALMDARKNARGFENFLASNERYRVYNQNTNFRVYQLNNPFNESRTSFFHKSIGGYSAVKLGRYQDLIDFHLGKERQEIVSSLQNNGQGLESVLRSMNILNMLNTRFIIYNPDADPIENPYAFGNAWFVSELVWANDPDEEMLTLGKIDPQIQAVSDQKFKSQVSENNFAAGSEGIIKMESYKANEIVYSSNNKANGFAVFSEVYYGRGWNAYIDDQLADHIRVNYLLRGMEIPSGTHRIVFRFEPKDYSVSNSVGYASSGLLILFALGLIANEFRNRKEED